MESRSVKRVVGFVRQEKCISKYRANDVAFDFVSPDPPLIGIQSRVMGDYPARFGEHF